MRRAPVVVGITGLTTTQIGIGTATGIVIATGAGGTTGSDIELKKRRRLITTGTESLGRAPMMCGALPGRRDIFQTFNHSPAAGPGAPKFQSSARWRHSRDDHN